MSVAEQKQKGREAAAESFRRRMKWTEIAKVAGTFFDDPPDSAYQRGYLEYVKERLTEALR